MHIVCPLCAASYEVAEAAMGRGRAVRCTNCQHVWIARAPEPAEALADAGEADWSEAAPPVAGGSDATPAAETSRSDDSNAAATQPDFGLGEPAPAPVGATSLVDDAPSLLPDANGTDSQPNFSAASIEGDLDDPEDFAARRAARRRLAAKAKAVSRPSWPTIILALLTVIAAILAWRAEVVRAAPQTASLFARIGLPVNLRGLSFEDVKIERDTAEGVSVLVVRGAVTNVTRRRVEVPRLRFAVRDPSGAEVYHWTAQPARATLAAGESLEFQTRLASPPAEAHDVQVRFFGRRDR